MPELSRIHVIGLQPLIEAFEGHPSKTPKTHLLDGEKHNDEYLEVIYDGKDNQMPTQFSDELLVTDVEIEHYKIDKGNPYPAKSFLWVIDERSVKILWEMTPNSLRGAVRPDRPYVCHTNITGNGKAYIGGEMYFCQNGTILINFSSDRYGVVASEEKKNMAIQYFQDCNYKNIVRVDRKMT